MSDSFFKQINQLTTAWEPPPRPSENGWLEGFDDASELQKKNIANSWMWSLNNEFITSDDACKTIFLVSYYRTYAKLGPYVDADKFRHHPYDGTFEAVTQRESPGRWNNMSAEIRDKFLAACEEVWFNPHADKMKAYEKVLDAVHLADIHGKRQMDRFYPILMKEVWSMLDKGNVTGEDWQKIATYLTVRGALDGMNTGPCTQALAQLHQGRAWYMLALHAKYNNSMDITSVAQYKSVVHATNPRAAALSLRAIIAQAYVSNAEGEHCLRPNTTLNTANEPSTDIYGMLREWLPTLTDYWNTAESLGITYHDALGYAAEGTVLDKPNASLPEDFTAESIEKIQL